MVIHLKCLAYGELKEVVNKCKFSSLSSFSPSLLHGESSPE